MTQCRATFAVLTTSYFTENSMPYHGFRARFHAKLRTNGAAEEKRRGEAPEAVRCRFLLAEIDERISFMVAGLRR